MAIEREEARRATVALLRHGPRRLDDIRLGGNVREARLVEAAIAHGDVEEVNGYLVMTMSRTRGDAAEDVTPYALHQDPRRRKAAEEIMRGIDDVASVIEMIGDGGRETVDAMITEQQAFSSNGRIALTPFGRVSLVLEPRETAMLYAIASGERGEKKLVETNPENQATITALVEQGIIGKMRRYYEIRLAAFRIVAGAQGVPSAGRLMAGIASI